jgi:protein-histidine pros-kinase
MEGKIEITNTQTEKLFGYTRNELVGNSIEILLPERFRGKHPRHRSNFFSHPETRAMGAGRDLFGLHKNGQEIPLEIGLNPINTPEGTLVLAAIIDISERKKAEEAGRAKEIAEASVKMKDHFMANMSHEVRTPMNAIIGFSDLLEKTSLTAEQKQFVSAVKTSGQNLLTIINDILDISKIESGKMIIEKIPMNIADLLTSLYEVMKHKAEEKGLELIFDYPKNKNFIVWRPYKAYAGIGEPAGQCY